MPGPGNGGSRGRDPSQRPARQLPDATDGVSLVPGVDCIPAVRHVPPISSLRPSFYKLDIVALLLVLAGVVWGIKQRAGLSAVPLLTPDSWGYLNPAL